ncbi:MAG TPA: type II toxin-antitoxin system RelE/ParE family toxin [Ideonella sp.]|uniref:type II toxin-antitoxin system RelE/ParE family toxin n=1 Tax=Ideonella sp. TaxID=1929293 RepID=UPI002C55F204|nr:type II toxin-antitoxin system RelE/ParE family toxin [Ideonella sp.]HSI52002.1 type II toxin-antitoxin system RelE/ParE family toxin [Ideonella sp.]
MSQFEVVILPDAETEIAGAFQWYRERNPLAAEAFRTEALDCIDALANSAEKWKKDDDDTRHCLLRRFPYTVFYEIEGAVVFVLAVSHQRREPGYWRDR